MIEVLPRPVGAIRTTEDARIFFKAHPCLLCFLPAGVYCTLILSTAPLMTCSSQGETLVETAEEVRRQLENEEQLLALRAHGLIRHEGEVSAVLQAVQRRLQILRGE
jgi:hypothetical protein